MEMRLPYLTRYLAGEHEQVWGELMALGEGVREEPYFTDAMAVARETMRRVQHNISLLIPRLRASGYVFGYQWAVERGVSSLLAAEDLERQEPLVSPPSRLVGETIDELERRTGTLPLSLRAFYEQVGGVNFVGAHPVWGSYGLDALVVESAEQLLEIDEWAHWSDDKDADGTCTLWIAPDEHHKYFISGDLYTIRVPALSADVVFAGERHHTTFVNYLRLCLRWAGLPNLEHILANASTELPEIVALTHEFLLF